MRLDFEGLWPYALERFGHGSGKANGACGKEVVAHLAGEPITDKPLTASYPVGLFYRITHDGMDRKNRQKLKRLIPMMIGSFDSGTEEARADYLAKWALQVAFPIALEAAGQRYSAKWMREEPGFQRVWWKAALQPTRAITEHIPLVRDCTDHAVKLFTSLDKPERVSLAANLAVSVMNINEDLPRELSGTEGWRPVYGRGPKPVKVGMAPQIYDAVVDAIEEALRLGKHGAALDPWEVLARAADFERDLAAYREKLRKDTPIRRSATFVK